MKLSVTVLAAGVLLYGFQASALEAIPSYQFYTHGFVGYAVGGAGFTFSPHTDLTITALGYDNGDGFSQPATVGVSDANWVSLASTIITSNSKVLSWASYEQIPPLTLRAGQTYYIWSFWTNGVWYGPGLVTQGGLENGTFTVAPDIAYLGAFESTNTVGSPSFHQESPAVLLLGPNFMYVTSTMVKLSGLQVTSSHVQIDFNLAGAPVPSFTLLESDQPGGPWTTNSAGVLTTNVPGVSYTFVTAPNGPARFYRVQTP
ncbi:MAG TPA: hypothetical protein VN578_14915 [Candidatus Binatia bacterium]|jgi:hypothetical protein|nr:hypothetical protein [Candidatus Binatia bacterium]